MKINDAVTAVNAVNTAVEVSDLAYEFHAQGLTEYQAEKVADVTGWGLFLDQWRDAEVWKDA